MALLPLAAACASPGPAPEAGHRTAEQEVLLMIVAEHGRGAVLMDNTFGHGCLESSENWCDEPSAPPEAWQAYLRAANRSVPLRDLLPATRPFTYASDLGDQSVLPCERRSGKLQLSRVGFSRDGRWGIVTYGVSMPATAPMCSHGYGATVVVRRGDDGAWVVDRALSTTIS